MFSRAASLCLDAAQVLAKDFGDDDHEEEGGLAGHAADEDEKIWSRKEILDLIRSKMLANVQQEKAYRLQLKALEVVKERGNRIPDLDVDKVGEEEAELDLETALFHEYILDSIHCRSSETTRQPRGR